MVNLALTRASGATDFAFSYPDYAAYRDSAHSFSSLIAFSPEHTTLSNTGGIMNQRTSAVGSHAEFASVFVVSENYLFCFWPSRCLPRTHRRGEPCASIPWWRFDTNKARPFGDLLHFNMNSGGFAGELEVTFFLVFVIAAVLDGGFYFYLLLAGGDFFG